MSRKISVVVKREWLQDWESGKSEATIARANRRDVRTVKKGIEEARRERDIRSARAELLKDALRRHHNALIAELEGVLSSLALPSEDLVPLSWYRGADSIFYEASKKDRRQTAVAGDGSAKPVGETNVKWGLLEEHLKNDPVWKLLARQKEDAFRHLERRIALQRKTVAIIERETGCKLLESGEPPFLYSYNAGDLLFRETLRRAFGSSRPIDLEAEIVANTAARRVDYRGAVLAEAPGHEEASREHLLAAFRRLQKLPEVKEIVDTYKQLKESAAKAKYAVEQLLALGIIPGQCQVCRRLGV